MINLEIKFGRLDNTCIKRDVALRLRFQIRGVQEPIEKTYSSLFGLPVPSFVYGDYGWADERRGGSLEQMEEYVLRNIAGEDLIHRGILYPAIRIKEIEVIWEFGEIFLSRLRPSWL